MTYTSNLAMNRIDNTAEVQEPVTTGVDNIVRLDLSRFDTRDMVQEAIRQEEAEKPVKVVEAPRKRLFLSSLLYCFAFAALALVLLLNNLDLTVLTDQVADKKETLAELKSQESILRTEYDKRFNLSSVEDYAVNTLGMVKIERSQVEYIEIKAPETIQMIEPEEQENFSYYIANLVKSFNAVLKNLD